MTKTVRHLLSAGELAGIWDAPLIGAGRHPTWYPIFASEARTVDHLTNQAVAVVAGRGDNAWLTGLAPRISRPDDYAEAAATLAELRAYGALLEAGFNVRPIPVSDDSTPDFEIDAGDGSIIVEVFAKHEDKKETELWNAVRAGPVPSGSEHHESEGRGRKVQITISEHHPAGAPDPAKPADSVQANAISRICAAKGEEKQFPSDRPSLLWIDLRSFGGWPEALTLEQCMPLASGHSGLTSGAIWYAFYGWKDAPIFEEDFPLHERIVPMGHDGRFRLSAQKKSKLSGAIIVLSHGLVHLENPWATNQIPDRARRYMERLPCFNIGHSICNWAKGDAEGLVECGRRQVEAMKQWRDRLDP